MTNDARTHLSRREILKRGAVAGAVVWSVPMIASSPAFAATGKCSGSRPCTRFFGVKFDNDKQAVDGAPGGGGGGNCPPRYAQDLRCPGDATSTLETGNAALNHINDWNISSGGGMIELKSGVVPLVLEVKFSTNCSAWSWNGSVFEKEFSVNDHGITNVTVTGTLPSGYTIWYTGSSISNVGIYFCI